MPAEAAAASGREAQAKEAAAAQPGEAGVGGGGAGAAGAPGAASPGASSHPAAHASVSAAGTASGAPQGPGTAPESLAAAAAAAAGGEVPDDAGTGVTFTPIYGCYDDTGRGSGPVCSLLEVGDVTIMLDCGWDLDFDPTLLAPLAEVVPRVDLVLVSHADLEHIGGLPYAVGRLGLRAPIFATQPTLKMGQMAVYDAHQMRTMESGGEFRVFTLDDADAAFDLFKPLKYSQHLRFSEGGRGAGVTITPYAAGHIIGSSLWRICWQTDDNDIVYAVCFNHRREEHLNGGALETLSRPSIMITDAHQALTVPAKPPGKRAGDLIELIMGTVRKGGNVLLPCDTAGRVLELLLLLDLHWTRLRLGTYPLVLLHSMAFNTGEFAKSQLEWMSSAISRQFDLQRSNPFEMKHVAMVHSLEELEALGSGPMVVLATDLSLDYGFAKALLLAWAADPLNLVLLTQRGHGDSVARELLRGVTAAQAEAAAAGAAGAGGAAGEGDAAASLAQVQRVVVEVPERVPLADEELKVFQEEADRRRRKAAEEEEHRRQAEEMERGQVLADSDDEEASDAAAREHDSKRRRLVTASLFSKYSKPQHLMFGFHDTSADVDDYGVREKEVIGWLAMSMQERNDTTTLLEEEGHRRMLEQQAAARLSEAMQVSGAMLDNESAAAAAVAAAAAQSGLRSDSAFYQYTGVLPTKVVSREQELVVRARVAYIDMEGLSDARSVRNLVATVGPRQLVLAGGGAKGVAALTKDAQERHAVSQVFAPQSGETVTLTLDTEVFDVKVHDSLYTRLRWQSLKGFELAQVNCTVIKDPVPAAGGRPPPPILLPPQDTEDGESGRPAVFVSFGDVQLPQLSTALKKAGMATTLAAGKLTVEGGVEVTKGGDGQLQIDGPLSDAYFAVRSIVYRAFTVVS